MHKKIGDHSIRLKSIDCSFFLVSTDGPWLEGACVVSKDSSKVIPWMHRAEQPPLSTYHYSPLNMLRLPGSMVSFFFIVCFPFLLENACCWLVSSNNGNWDGAQPRGVLIGLWSESQSVTVFNNVVSWVLWTSFICPGASFAIVRGIKDVAYQFHKIYTGYCILTQWLFFSWGLSGHACLANDFWSTVRFIPKLCVLICMKNLIVCCFSKVSPA